MRLHEMIFYKCRVKHIPIVLFLVLCLFLLMDALLPDLLSAPNINSSKKSSESEDFRNPAFADWSLDRDVHPDRDLFENATNAYRPPNQQRESPKIHVPSIDLAYKNKYGHYRPPDEKFVQYFEKLPRIVHFDLKGAPPKVDYLRKLFPYLKKAGATAILMEYEDMFPFEKSLAQIAANNAYNSTDLEYILNLAKENELDIIPLVQTFGHLEFVLKYEQYKPLREIAGVPQVITPAKTESYDLLFEMLDQVVKKHPGIKHLHIGCDEVYNLGAGQSRSYMSENKLSKEEVFLEHVKKITTHIVEQHNVMPIMWDDEMRHGNTTLIIDSGLRDLVEPMVWSYTPDLISIPRDIWPAYGKIFKNIWIASAFKGATGSNQYITDTTYHLKNHYAWIDIIKTYGVDRHGVNFAGLALTGWQRYDHFGNLCELLPAAIPSMTACLQTFRFGGFGKHEHELTSSFLKCSSTVELNPLEDSFTVSQCSFPGSEVYYDIKDYHKIVQKYLKYLKRDALGNWLTPYHVQKRFFSSGRMNNFRDRFLSMVRRFNLIEHYMRKHLSLVYDNFTVEEWISQNIAPFLSEFKTVLKDIRTLSEVSSWDKRPQPPTL